MGLLPAPPEKVPDAADGTEAAEEAPPPPPPSAIAEPALYPYLANLAVKSGARRIGLGAALVRETEQQAAELGYDRVYIKVDRQNFDARRLYDGLGYRLVYLQNKMPDRTNKQTQFLFLRRDIS